MLVQAVGVSGVHEDILAQILVASARRLRNGQRQGSQHNHELNLVLKSTQLVKKKKNFLCLEKKKSYIIESYIIVILFIKCCSLLLCQ